MHVHTTQFKTTLKCRLSFVLIIRGDQTAHCHDTLKLKLTSFGLPYMNPNVWPLTARLFILRKICRETAQMHNEMQSKQAFCQCENRQSSLAENELKCFCWSVSVMGVIIVLFGEWWDAPTWRKNFLHGFCK